MIDTDYIAQNADSVINIIYRINNYVSYNHNNIVCTKMLQCCIKIEFKH